MTDSPQTIFFEFDKEGTLSRSDAPGRLPIPKQRYFLNDNPLSEGLSTSIDNRFADWLDIAHATYLADRLVRRPWSYERNASASWSRRMHLRLPVRNPEFWNSSRMMTLLIEILSFLTEDIWSFEFIPGKPPRNSERQQYLFGCVSGPVEVALLSAGLDSFAGAAIRSAALPDSHFVFVSGATSPKLRCRQSEQFHFLSGGRPQRATHVALEHHLVAPPGRCDLENSQRSRGFLHLTLGCIAALSIGARRLHVYENGVGAINLPLDASQMGVFNSRPVNPCTLIQMSKLAQTVSEVRGFKIVNPFLFATKGQMCSAAPVVGASEMLRRTISCDRPPRTSERGHCGSCSSCVLRRLSLHAAGLLQADPGDEYVCDIYSPDPKLSRSRWVALEKMRWQVGVLQRALDSQDPWRALAEQYWMLPRIASELQLSEERDDICVQLVSLYQAYVKEWLSFPATAPVFREELAA